MKHLRLLIVLLACSSLSLAVGIANTHEDTGTGTAVPSAAFTASAGNIIFALCATGTGGWTINTPTDAGGNTYIANQGPTTVGNTKIRTFYALSITGFTGSVTCHTSTSTFQVVDYFEMSGATAADVSAADLSYTATASPWASNTLTTVNGTDVIVTYVVNDAVTHTYTQPAGFTLIISNNDVALAYEVVTGTVSTAYTWTGTGAADNMIVGALSFVVPNSFRRPPLAY